MKRNFLLLLKVSLFILPGFTQPSFLQSGPMLGYSEMQEVMLWAQTTEPARVQFAYWLTENPLDTFFTDLKRTVAEEAFTAHLVADQVEPGGRYTYQLRINGKPLAFDHPTEFQSQALWQWRTDPPGFTLAVGSCFYVNETEYDRPGTPYGSNYEIVSAIHAKRPDLMVWLGDNTYLREVDWYTRTGFFHRYTHTRSLPELQPLLASTHHYAVWDDHDYGPNDSDRSFVHKELAEETFSLFWGNPTVGLPGLPGITTFFKWNDIDFFLLDDRYFRSPNRLQHGDQTLLGKEQLDWLIDALVFSRAPFKMVCTGGQVLNTAEVHETYANLQPEERAYLLQRIEEEDITGVIFLTGDRHHSELSTYVNGAGNAVYDLTISPLTAGVARNVTEVNELRVEGTLLQQHNFGLLEFSGPRTARRLTIRTFSHQGEELWVHEIDTPK